MNNNVSDLYLKMGYDENTYLIYQNEFDKLFDSYDYLSKLIIKNKDGESFNYFCDFNSFFMYYDAFLLSKKCNVHRLIHLLTESFNRSASVSDENKDYLINDVETYKNSIKMALKFIRDYAKLDLMIKEELNYDTRKKVNNSRKALKNTKKQGNDSLLTKFGHSFIKKYDYLSGNNFHK